MIAYYVITGKMNTWCNEKYLSTAHIFLNHRSEEKYSVFRNLILLPNGGCPENGERPVGGKVDPFFSFCTLPGFYVLDSRHQLSHSHTMFHSVSSIYDSVCLSEFNATPLQNLFEMDWPHTSAVSVNKSEFHITIGPARSSWLEWKHSKGQQFVAKTNQQVWLKEQLLTVGRCRDTHCSGQ